MAELGVSARRRRWAPSLFAVLAVVMATFGASAPAGALTVIVKGSAYGFYSKVTVFSQCVDAMGGFTPGVPGNPNCERGPTPTVTLLPVGSATPVTATAPSGSAVYGPATIFDSGRLDVSTQGAVGLTGSAASSASVQNVNASGNESLTAASVAAGCAATEGSVSGSTTITSGTLQTDNGLDLNDDGDFTDPGEHAPVTVTVPANPAPNTSISGHLHVGGGVDAWRYVFNEQALNADGSLTVYAAHQYLMGPTAVGDLFVGKAECGVVGLRL